MFPPCAGWCNRALGYHFILSFFFQDDFVILYVLLYGPPLCSGVPWCRIPCWRPLRCTAILGLACAGHLPQSNSVAPKPNATPFASNQNNLQQSMRAEHMLKCGVAMVISCCPRAASQAVVRRCAAHQSRAVTHAQSLRHRSRSTKQEHPNRMHWAHTHARTHAKRMVCVPEGHSGGDDEHSLAGSQAGHFWRVLRKV